MPAQLLNGAPTQPVLNIAAPLNDMQLVSLMAAQIRGESPEDAVAMAVELVAEAIVQTPGLPALVRAKQKAAQEAG